MNGDEAMAKHKDVQDTKEPVENTETKEEQPVEHEIAPDEELPVDVGADELSSLRLEIETLKEQLEAEHDRYLRALADFNNYKKRQEQMLESIVQSAKGEVLKKFLPVLDNFERALAAVQETKSFEALAEGIEMTLKQLQSVLEEEGVKPIPAVGEQFDPSLHEAVMSEPSEEAPEHTILAEYEKGYTHNSKVLRASKVKVSK